MMGWDAASLLARIGLVLLFPFSALDKMVHWDAALKQAGSSILPGAPLLLAAAIVVEIAAPLLIVVGWHGRLAAALLAAYCVVTALLYHRFWTFPHYWSAEDTEGRRHLWDFLKNLGLAGGLLLLVIGAGIGAGTPG